MNKEILNEFIAAAQKSVPPDVTIKMSMDGSTQSGYEHIDYEFSNKSQSSIWNPGVNRELALRIYDRLCHCRDMEIELVWKRAVFMTAFLIACFAGYGGLIVAGLSRTYSDRAFFFMTVAACFLATIGFALSVLWIMMCKGSKAWYEHYEQAIEAHAQEIFVGKCIELFSHDWRTLTGDKRSKEMSKCLLSTKGGAYSVSQLAIVIGQLAAIIWVIILVGHGVVLSYVLWPITKWAWTFYSVMAVVAGGLALVGMLSVIICSLYIAKSGYLSNLPPNGETKETGAGKQ